MLIVLKRSIWKPLCAGIYMLSDSSATVFLDSGNFLCTNIMKGQTLSKKLRADVLYSFQFPKNFCLP